MSVCLGLDTSNYTTSAAALGEAGEIAQEKKLLPVAPGAMGLRQSDAVFHHVRQLPELLEALRQRQTAEITAVAASDRPQQTEGSYMPCFLVGAGAARELGAALKVPVYFFTHQQGHVAAALLGADRTALAQEEFLAFHVSGGTTDALLVRPDPDTVLSCRVVARSLDLKAGQLVDRVGGLLGLPFPAGPALEILALRGAGSHRPKAVLRGADCHLSGVENQCMAMKARGEPPEEIARFCLLSILAALTGMAGELRRTLGPLPLVFAGGDMSNRLLRQALEERFGGCFAPPAFSADNAAGVAWLCARKREILGKAGGGI